ncbi:glyceraldehyde 3-phosphate dehydrogenase NAD-binding domain-containing protein [Micromonospora sp. CPCC 206061]|uniref:glyceraldehyde 3-phosphate dehydrogenase NAD-binding domain-containing protein n=1 Tax=Micromonospora sp. CPCC 206061 TaxID=3122410 RepID=UPI002FF3B483
MDDDGLELVAINDVADVDNLAYLLRYDTVYERYHRDVSAADGALLVDGKPIPAFSEHDPTNPPRAALGVDLVLECTGVFKAEEGLKTAPSGRRVVRDPVCADGIAWRAHRGARRESRRGRAGAANLVPTSTGAARDRAGCGAAAVRGVLAGTACAGAAPAPQAKLHQSQQS